jgi:hypothetical protein
MDVIGFPCVSLGSSKVQLHDSIGSRCIYAFQRLVSVVKMATVLEEYITEEQHSVVRFCGQKFSMQRTVINKCFRFMVGSICYVKHFTNLVQKFS